MIKQAVMPEPGKVVIHSIMQPSPQQGEVLLKIQRIGICGSDVHVFHGRHPLTPYPVVQGHEFSATIESVGPGVVGFKKGDAVTALPQITCGTCSACKRGAEHICDTLRVQGFQAPGCAQEYWTTDASQVVLLPEGFNYDMGAMVEPTAVGIHAIRRIGGVHNKRVLVVGAGPIGNLMAQCAMAEGAEKVLISDVGTHRLDIARACGLEHTHSATTETLKDAAERVFGAESYDVVFECAGTEAALTPAIAHMQKGGTLVVVAVYATPAKVDMTLVQDRELSIVGSLMYQRVDYEKAIAHMHAGNINITPLLSSRFPLEKYAEAYDFVNTQKDRVMKVMINVQAD
jgi:L-iditol 2-dehydrogenase